MSRNARLDAPGAVNHIMEDIGVLINLVDKVTITIEGVS
jgi:hypothetical protein